MSQAEIEDEEKLLAIQSATLCRNGHRNPIGNKFCAKCGIPLRKMGRYGVAQNTKSMSLKRFFAFGFLTYGCAILGYFGVFDLILSRFQGVVTSSSLSTSHAISNGTNFMVAPNVGFTATVSGPSTAYVAGFIPVFNRFVGYVVGYHIIFLLVSTAGLCLLLVYRTVKGVKKNNT